MKKIITYLSVFASLLILCTCKKQPDSIIISTIDPFMNKPIPYAKIGLIERSLNGGVFSGGYECEIINTFETDENGSLIIEKTKFKTKKSVDYFVTVLNAYGKDLFYSCGNRKEADILPKTNASITKKIYAYGSSIDWKFNINSLNSQGFGSLSTDYIKIKIYRDFEYFVDLVDNLNGSKQFIKEINLDKITYENLNNPTSPETYSCCTYNYLDKIYPGKYKVQVIKNKNGVQSNYTFTEYVSPNVNIYYFNIDW